MVIKPRFRDFICVTAHPEGCEKNVHSQIEYVKKNSVKCGYKRVLIIGASTGYGLSSRIMSTFGWGASTIGIVFEKPGKETRTGTAGWYNTAAFTKKAIEDGHYAKTINGDAFSSEIKKQTIDLIKKDFGKIDLLIYSIAAPRRKNPSTGEISKSVLKPIGQDFKSKTIDISTYNVSNVEVSPANDEEIKETVDVMGGDDIRIWIDELLKADVLEKGFDAVSYSYIGPEITYPIYRHGTIGRAKEDMESAIKDINDKLKVVNGRAFVSVNKSLVTQSSAAIPVIPLYYSLLDKVMREKNIQEDSVEQIHRLFSKLSKEKIETDSKGRIRLDDRELRQDVQDEVKSYWNKINSDNVREISNIDEYKNEFLNLFGFGCEGINYEADTKTDIDILNLL